jgi:hypothetical protein
LLGDGWQKQTHDTEAKREKAFCASCIVPKLR